MRDYVIVLVITALVSALAGAAYYRGYVDGRDATLEVMKEIP